jgi:hypothetical protein
MAALFVRQATSGRIRKNKSKEMNFGGAVEKKHDA